MMHDMPALGLMYELVRVTGERKYKEGADRYFAGFAKRAGTASGLFPWGEHSYLDLDTGGIGDAYLYAVYSWKRTKWWDGEMRPAWHDHLRLAPPWFWEKLKGFAPELVQRFADGLDRHWLTDERKYYMRHAGIDRVMRHGYRKGDRYCDFPRHSGHYLVDLACAYMQEPRRETLEQIWRYADHWWKRFDAGEFGERECLPLESTGLKDRSHPGHHHRNPGQTLSLAVSLLDAADEIRGAEARCADELEKRGRAYLEVYLEAPHKPEEGVFVAAYSRVDRSVVERLPLYGSVYGLHPVAAAALLYCAVYRRCGDERFLRWAEIAARGAMKAALEVRNPGGEIVHTGMTCNPETAPALDAGMLLELLCDLYEITDGKEWLESARKLWPVIHERYFHKDLIRRAMGNEWYESQCCPAYLLHGAARLGLLEEGVRIAPEYSAR